MGNIVWNKKSLLEFEDDDREFLINCCEAKNVAYISEDEDIIVYPALHDKTFILNDLTQHEELKTLIKSLKKSLIKQGATVILEEGLTDKSSLEYLDAEIIMVFSLAEKQTDLTIYLPFDIEEISFSITKQLLRKLNSIEKKTTYKIANMLKKLKTAKYWTYLFGNATPALVLEIGKPNINDTLFKNFLNNFEDMLVKTVIEEFGHKASEEEKDNILEFVDNLNQKITCTKMLDKEQQELEALAYKLECCENELDELKQSYTEKEEELQKISSNIEESVIEESENIEIESTDIQDISSDSSQQVEERKPTDNKKSSRKKSKKKNDKTKSKKLNLPMKSKKNINQGYSYQHSVFPIRYPGDGPVYQFQRPKPNSTSLELPPSFKPKMKCTKKR